MLPSITMEGRLVANPELQFTASGVALCKFRMAANDRKKDPQTGQYEDGDPIFLSVTCWRNMAQNVADSLQQGDLVVVTGKLRQRDYEVEGQRRSSYEIDPDSVSPSLRFQSAHINRTQRQQAGQPQYQGQGADDPWATQAQQGRAVGVQPQQQQAPQGGWQPAAPAPQQPAQAPQQGWGQQVPSTYDQPPF